MCTQMPLRTVESRKLQREINRAGVAFLFAVVQVVGKITRQSSNLPRGRVKSRDQKRQKSIDTLK